MEENTFDAIVVGSGISGGWAAMELCRKGLKTIVLERGRQVKHIVDYKTANLEPWQLPNAGRVPLKEKEEHYKVQSRAGYTVHEARKHFFVKDSEHPYTEINRFDWMRGYHEGGRSLMWGRQVYRWSDLDFEANAKEGIGVDWPIRYKDIAPWYSYVEKFIGISGEKLGLPHLPDGEFMPPMELNCVEKHLRESIDENFEDRVLTVGRIAHLTGELEHDLTPHRGKCQYRNRCMRGCPFGAYFSSNSSTLHVAKETGNMTLRPHSIVHSVIYDEATGKASGVKVIDSETKEMVEFKAKIIFLNASTIGSTSILLNSTSDRFPNGMGNDSGELGHNMMDHHFHVGAHGSRDDFKDQYFYGRRPNGIYIPRFRNLNGQKKRDYIRGFGYQGGASRAGTSRGAGMEGLGKDFKDGLTQPGDWSFNLLGFGECLPYHENFMRLSKTKKDQFGMPILEIDALFRENETKMRVDMQNDAAEMLEKAGFKDVSTYDNKENYHVGLGIHEMGTARMGRDAKTSVLNKNNQVHGVPNVFVTDGACMTSAGCQNPSITYMALTARAVDFAVKELKKQNL
ncbi:MAG: GMC oxidoreductase [Saprospiraceae bacterium]